MNVVTMLRMGLLAAAIGLPAAGCATVGVTSDDAMNAMVDQQRLMDTAFWLTEQNNQVMLQESLTATQAATDASLAAAMATQP